MSAREKRDDPLGRRSPAIFRFFVFIFGRMLQKEFHAVRVSNRPENSAFQAPNLVIYSNHSSWWDGVTFLFVADRFLSGRKVYTPVDAAMVERYGFVSRIGAFGVEKGRLHGARRFLETCRTLFADPCNVLLITAQGRFADCRERPLKLESGIAHVADLAPGATYLPLAIEYTHWLEKQPELLMRFGEPIAATSLIGESTALRLESLEAALAITMDTLARESVSRDILAFETLVVGRGGVNAIYDLWRRILALLTGRAFQASHGARP